MPAELYLKAAEYQVTYAYTIISFLGGVMWGTQVLLVNATKMTFMLSVDRFCLSVFFPLSIWIASAAQLPPGPGALLSAVLLIFAYGNDAR